MFVCSTKRKKCLDDCKNACGIRACVACGAMHRHHSDSRVRTAPFLHNQGCMCLMEQVYLSRSAALSEPVFTGSFVAFTFIRLRYKYVSIKMAEVRKWLRYKYGSVTIVFFFFSSKPVIASCLRCHSYFTSPDGNQWLLWSATP